MPDPHPKVFNAGTTTGAVTVIVPLPPVAGMEFESEATTPTRLMGRLPLAPAAIVKLAIAMAPSGMGVVLRPKTRQLVPLQLSNFPADDAEPPIVVVTPVIPAGKLKDHCAAVG